MEALIPVAKGGEYLEVHPTTLQAHKELGWRECEKRELPVESSGGDPDGAKKPADMKVDELKAALAEKQIAIPDGAKKADLVALLEAALQVAS